MRANAVLLSVVCILLAASTYAHAQGASASDIDRLKTQVEKQQARIEALESALAAQQQMLIRIASANPDKSIPVTTVESATANLKTVAYDVETVENSSQQQEQQPLSPKAQKAEDELQRGPEIADVTPTTPALNLGPAKIRLIGYAALSNIYRSTNSGGNVATSFGSLPFDNTVAGNTSEFRLSAQNTRLAMRADADLKSSKVAGYFEIDFLGQVPGNVAAASPSNYGLRMRHAWFDFQKGKWEITGGQLFSLITPLKNTISPWPGDVSLTQVVDQNFVAGLVWGRSPQVRVVYHYSDAVSFGFSAENPEQQVGGTVVFPSMLAPTLGTQYNTGSQGLAVPNAIPDFLIKASFDGKLGRHAAHLDLGGVMREFRNYAPFEGNGVSGHNHAFGGGGSLNATFDVATGYRFVVNAFAGSGAGRYIGGLIPDVIVRANGDISPIKAYSWVSGLEIAPSTRTGLYVYYSGVYGQKNVAVDTDGSFIGWGYPGASNAAERTIQEITPGFSHTFWKQENLGSVQLGIQYAYVVLHPWVAGTGPSAAHTQMVLGQIRYNLP
jgi:hypothetical protein